MTTKTEMTLEKVCFRYVKGEEYSEKCKSFIDEKHTNDIVASHWWIDGYFYSRYNGKIFTDKKKSDRLTEVSPSDYLLLLSAPESQAHLLTEKDRHELEYNMHSKGITWCPICKEHFYNEVPFHIIESKLASQPPVMEGKKETLQDVIKRVSPFGTMTISNPKMLIALEDFIGQKTSSLQSEVEQLKGLLRECMNYLEDERAIIEQAVNTDNYACIPDKDLKLIYNQVSKYLSK